MFFFLMYLQNCGRRILDSPRVRQCSGESHFHADVDHSDAGEPARIIHAGHPQDLLGEIAVCQGALVGAIEHMVLNEYDIKRGARLLRGQSAANSLCHGNGGPSGR